MLIEKLTIHKTCSSCVRTTISGVHESPGRSYEVAVVHIAQIMSSRF